MNLTLTNLRPLLPTVGLYILSVFCLSTLIYIPATISNLNGGDFGLYALPLMWVPAISTLITLNHNGRDIRQLEWKWPTTNYVLMSWYVPIAYSVASYIIVWVTPLGGFPNRDFMDKISLSLGLRLPPILSTILYILLRGTFGVAPSMSSAIGEEIGWRGYLIPELMKSFSFTTSSIFTGLIWSVWHWPLIIATDSYSSPAPWPYKITCFTISVTALSVIISWIRLKSGSLWTSVIVHATHNLYIQVLLTPLTFDTRRTYYYIDEFGCMLCITTVITAVYFWKRRSEVESSIRLP